MHKDACINGVRRAPGLESLFRNILEFEWIVCKPESFATMYTFPIHYPRILCDLDCGASI